MHFMIIDTYEIIDFISGENINKTLYFIQQLDYAGSKFLWGDS